MVGGTVTENWCKMKGGAWALRVGLTKWASGQGVQNQGWGDVDKFGLGPW